MLWQVHSTVTGALLGLYSAESADSALDAMSRDAGYASYEHACLDSSGTLVATEATGDYEAPS